MTFLLASSGTCWWNCFVEKLHRLATGARRSWPVLNFSYTKNQKIDHMHNFVTNHIFWCQIQIQNVLSFHLVCILCIQIEKWQHSDFRLANFHDKSTLLRRTLTAKLCNIEYISKTLQIEEDVRNNIFPVFGLCSGLKGLQRPSFTCGLNQPPPGTEACQNLPALIGLTYNRPFIHTTHKAWKARLPVGK